MGTKEYGRMLKRIQVLEDRRVLAKEARIGNLRDKKKKNHEERVSEAFGSKFEMEGFMPPRDLWNLAGEKVLQDRGALPRGEGHAIREYKAMHEENFLDSWLREDGKSKNEGG